MTEYTDYRHQVCSFNSRGNIVIATGFCNHFSAEKAVQCPLHSTVQLIALNADEEDRLCCLTIAKHHTDSM